VPGEGTIDPGLKKPLSKNTYQYQNPSMKWNWCMRVKQN